MYLQLTANSESAITLIIRICRRLRHLKSDSNDSIISIIAMETVRETMETVRERDIDWSIDYCINEVLIDIYGRSTQLAKNMGQNMMDLLASKLVMHSEYYKKILIFVLKEWRRKNNTKTW